MAETSYPFYGQETQEDEFSDWASLLLDSGIIRGLTPTAGSGMNVSVAAGVAFIRGRYYENTSAKAVPINAAPGSGTRKDYVVLRIDLTAKTVVAVAKAGTTTGGGTLPALTQTDTLWEVPIAVVTVPSGLVSITGANIVAVRPLASALVYPYADESARPTPPAERPAVGVNFATGQVDLWSGSSWSRAKVAWADVLNQPTAPPAHTLDSHTGTLGVSKGGTGATDAAGARSNLGAAAASHTHPVSQISDSGAAGRAAVQAADLAAIREAVGIRVTSTPMGPGTPVGTIRIW